MKTRGTDLLLTALAPAIWGSTYVVTTKLLPDFAPMTVAMLRSLPAGLLLLLIARQVPSGIWWLRALVLGALNFSIFWTLLFFAAYRLPGGVAATILSVQPLIVIFLAHLLLANALRLLSVVAAVAGIIGVALLVLTPNAALDTLGIAAGIAGSVSMALGTVLSRKWQPPVSLVTFTAWQLTAGGLLLLPVVLFVDPPIPVPTMSNLLGLLWLGLIGAAATYILWFRGISRLEPAVISTLQFISPMVAVLLGWLLLGQALSILQMIGAVVVIVSIRLGQRATA